MNVFVYGTLLVPKIWDTVTGTTGLVSHPAALEGHLILRVRDAVYPGIVATTDAVEPVPGVIHLDVPESALRRLDAYEDDFYRREEVWVEVAGFGPMAAQAYRVAAEDRERILAGEPWTLAWFEEHGLEVFWGRVFAAAGG